MVVFDRSKSAIILLSSSANAEPMFPALLAEVLGDTYSPVQWMGYAPVMAPLLIPAQSDAPESPTSADC